MRSRHSERPRLAALAAIALSVSSAAPAAESGDDATRHVSAMSGYLASLPGMQVTLLGSYDVVQPNGQKIEFHELRQLALARPDRLRVRHVRSDGAEDLLVFDGKTISVLDGDAGVYAQAPQPGALDDAIVYFVRDLGMQLPLARLFTTRAPKELGGRLRDLVYVERTAVLAVPVHHVAGRGDGVDVQLWIAEGDQPLPVRIVLTYVNEPGQPQFRAQFVDWKIAPPDDPGAFQFSAPPDARRVAFTVQVPVATSPGTGARP